MLNFLVALSFMCGQLGVSNKVMEKDQVKCMFFYIPIYNKYPLIMQKWAESSDDRTMKHSRYIWFSDFVGKAVDKVEFQVDNFLLS